MIAQFGYCELSGRHTATPAFTVLRRIFLEGRMFFLGNQSLEQIPLS